MIIIILVTAVVFVIFYYYIFSQKPIPSEKSSSEFSQTLSQKNIVGRDIKTTFTSSKHQDIITYIQLAAAEKGKAIQYSYYSKAYTKMLSFYNETKDSRMKKAILELKNYAKTFSQYKESDFPEPK